jgi:hypothetical protein
MDPNEQFLQPAGTSFNPHRRHAFYPQKEKHYLSAVSNDFANLKIILMVRGRGFCTFLQ